MEIALKSLGKLIATCWDRAEISARSLVAEKYPAPSEEFITDLLMGELRTEIDKASKSRAIGRAFLADLHLSSPSLSSHDAQQVGGLVARVNPHSRWQEGSASGGDLGLIVTRPIVKFSRDHTEIEFRRDHAIGLLVQAKLARHKKKAGKYTWGALTKAQERMFPARREYYSLLLYRLNGEKKNNLGPLGWQLCRQYSVAEVKTWLKSDDFPMELSSRNLLDAMIARTLGTEDPDIIRTIIDPDAPNVRSIEIQIFWPDRAGPPESLKLRQYNQETQLHYLIR
jgi:hypothetical protein